MSHRKRKRKNPDFIFEQKHHPILSRTQFYWRLVRTACIAASIMLASLGIGACGFHFIENLEWIDATLNASMLLSGMGPVDRPTCSPGKIFASFYALFSGVIFLTVAAILFAPVFHRLIHKFHLDLEDQEDRSQN